MAVVIRQIGLDDALCELAQPAPGAPITAEAAKALAQTVALRGIGRVSPNPLVGAVVVDRHQRFAAAGAHLALGGDHAEVAAFASAAAAGIDVKGGTLYVTLEPCAHANRTPACAPRVAAEGIARVVYGMVDPNPRVNGSGAALLQDRGVTVTRDDAWTPVCEHLAETFAYAMRTGRPFVGLKAALSLDGAIARPGDRRVWITGPRARAYGHFLRLWYDAIVVGYGTVAADDPRLDARDARLPAGMPPRTPVRVVLDPHGRAAAGPLPQLARVEPERTLWITGEGKMAPPGVGHLTLVLDATGGGFAPTSILEALAARGLQSVLLEGGAGVYGSFLVAGAVQRLHLFQGATVLGSQSLGWTSSVPGGVTISRGAPTHLTPLGDDWLTEVRL